MCFSIKTGWCKGPQWQEFSKGLVRWCERSESWKIQLQCKWVALSCETAFTKRSLDGTASHAHGFAGVFDHLWSLIPNTQQKFNSQVGWDWTPSYAVCHVTDHHGGGISWWQTENEMWEHPSLGLRLVLDHGKYRVTPTWEASWQGNAN